MQDVEVVEGRGRALTAADFVKLAEIPPEIERFANLRGSGANRRSTASEGAVERVSQAANTASQTYGARASGEQMAERSNWPFLSW
jgi:hypothetical protein